MTVANDKPGCHDTTIICLPGALCKALQISQSDQNREDFTAGVFLLRLWPRVCNLACSVA